MKLSAICKLSYSKNATLIKDKSYEIYGENDEFFWIISDGNKNTPHYLMQFSKNKSVTYLLFANYFYTIKEERRLKLKKLNEKRGQNIL